MLLGPWLRGEWTFPPGPEEGCWEQVVAEACDLGLARLSVLLSYPEHAMMLVVSVYLFIYALFFFHAGNLSQTVSSSGWHGETCRLAFQFLVQFRFRSYCRAKKNKGTDRPAQMQIPCS